MGAVSAALVAATASHPSWWIGNDIPARLSRDFEPIRTGGSGKARLLPCLQHTDTALAPPLPPPPPPPSPPPPPPWYYYRGSSVLSLGCSQWRLRRITTHPHVTPPGAIHHTHRNERKWIIRPEWILSLRFSPHCIRKDLLLALMNQLPVRCCHLINSFLQFETRNGGMGVEGEEGGEDIGRRLIRKWRPTTSVVVCSTFEPSCNVT